MNTRIRITGFGGQGVITSGYILGKAATIFDEKYSIMTQSYGPEARGSACSSQIIISDEPALLPFMKEQDILVGLSQEGFDKHFYSTAENGIILIDENLVQIAEEISKGIRLEKIPSTQLAEKEIGKRIVTNIIMLGFLVAKTKIVTEQAMLDAVLSVVPSGMKELNSKALQLGLEYTQDKNVVGV